METPTSRQLMEQAESIERSGLNKDGKSICHAIFMVGAAISGALERIADCTDYMHEEAKKGEEPKKEEGGQ